MYDLFIAPTNVWTLKAHSTDHNKGACNPGVNHAGFTTPRAGPSQVHSNS